MDNYDAKFEKIKRDFENGIISTNDLSEEYIKRLMELYTKEIQNNKIEIENTKSKIKNLKSKIDNIV